MDIHNQIIISSTNKIVKLTKMKIIVGTTIIDEIYIREDFGRRPQIIEYNYDINKNYK